MSKLGSYYDNATIDTHAKAAEKVRKHLEAKGRSVTVTCTTRHDSDDGFDVIIDTISPSGRITESIYFVPPRGPIKYQRPSKS